MMIDYNRDDLSPANLQRALRRGRRLRARAFQDALRMLVRVFRPRPARRGAGAGAREGFASQPSRSA